MNWSRKRRADLVGDLNLLIDDLCVVWGICNHLRADDLISPGEILDADTFICAVLRAEELNPETSEYRNRIRKRFIDRYGNSITPESYASLGYSTE